MSLGFVVFLIFFAFSLSPFVIFGAVIDLRLELLPVEKFLRKHHQDGQFLPCSSYVSLQKILFCIFHLNF